MNAFISNGLSYRGSTRTRGIENCNTPHYTTTNQYLPHIFKKLLFFAWPIFYFYFHLMISVVDRTSETVSYSAQEDMFKKVFTVRMIKLI
jgi:hypothetical protein